MLLENKNHKDKMCPPGKNGVSGDTIHPRTKTPLFTIVEPFEVIFGDVFAPGRIPGNPILNPGYTPGKFGVFSNIHTVTAFTRVVVLHRFRSPMAKIILRGQKIVLRGQKLSAGDPDRPRAKTPLF